MKSLSAEQWPDGLWYVVRGSFEVAGPFPTEAKAKAWMRLLSD